MISFELVSIFTRLQQPESRPAATRELAAYTRTDRVMLFGKDQEVGVFLPAPGMPQTLQQGAAWQRFLAHFPATDRFQGPVPAPDGGPEVDALGITGRFGLCVLVFIGAAPAPDRLEAMAALLPLLGAKLEIERTALAADGHATAARLASQRANALNATLDLNRRELQAAYERAEQELVFRRQAEARLLEADRRKDDFLAMLAHELRNPLAPISMAAQILRVPGIDAARVQQTSEIIERQVNHMTSLLDDLLDVSRVTRGLVTLNMEVLDMKQIVAHAVEQARPAIQARRHHLSVELPAGPAHVRGDTTRLVQIVTNLLNNATRYSPEGGEIGLQLALGHGQVILTVRDRGIGIDATLMPHLFDLFTQGERSSHRSQGGLGLGLALVKSLAERHGGNVSADSAGLGQGSCFTVRLPQFEQVGALGNKAQQAPARPGAAPARRIMIVDDNVDAAQTLAMFLRGLGHEVGVAYNGNEALAMARELAPRVLLLDIGLPDMDGYALARALRALPGNAGATLVALTGYGQPADKEKSNSAGFDYHLTKPVAPDQLAALLAAAETPGQRECGFPQ